MSMTIPSCRDDLAGLDQIMSVSSRKGDPLWTELSIYYRVGAERPFIAVKEGRVDETRTTLQHRFAATSHGTLSAAVHSFDPSHLRARLESLLPIDAGIRFPSPDELRRRSAARRRGFHGTPMVATVLAWLYPGDMTIQQRVRLWRADFNIPDEMAQDALSSDNGKRPAPRWFQTWLQTMRCFDADAFDRLKEDGAW